MRVAETILEDREGEGHFRDPEKLTHYLLGSFAPGSGLLDESRRVADEVLTLIHEGVDAEALAAHIERSMGAVRDD